MWRFPYSSDEILKRMESLAESYVPQWRLNRHTPDIGSVIAMIFAGQMEQAAREYSRTPQQCMEELIHMLGIVPNPPAPARTILVMEADSACKDGIRIAKGSRFYGNAEEAQKPIAFRTRHDLLAVYAGLSCVLGISEAEKKIVSYLDNRKEEKKIGSYPDNIGSEPIPMFEFGGRNLYQEELVLKDALLNNESLSLKRFYAEKELFLEDVRIKAWGQNIAPLFLYDGEQELSLEGAAIFGNEIFPYKECYIGQDEVFSKAGAKVKCTFELEWGSFDSSWKKERQEELRPIMKCPPKSEKEEGPHIFPQEISISYYNGTGFKSLQCEEGTGMLTKVFSGRKRCCLHFRCPKDFQPMTAGGYHSRCIRLQVKRADNCYLPGAVFYYPILKNIKFSYTYGKKGVKAEHVLVHQGSVWKELTDQILKGEECELFSDFPYKDENMLFGFDRVWGTGPVSFYLELENQARTQAAELSYEYSTEEGFKALHIIDGTLGLRKSGIVRFVLPEDAGMLEIEGRKCFWIRMRDRDGKSFGNGSLKRGLPLKALKLNGVEAENLTVSEERTFQLEKVETGLKEKLFESHILGAEVWVNEISTLSDTQKAALLEERPQDVQIEYDIRGQAYGFYVRWKESVDLEKQEGDGRYYMLDRKEGVLQFGDGRHTKIPSETAGIAWKMTVTSCDGRLGNVKKGMVTDPALSYVFLNRVYNPAGAYGGSDGENEEELARRGRDFLSTGQKIVSEADFITVAEGFSKQIGQAVLKKNGAHYRLLILLKEPEKGGFVQLAEALQIHLEKRFPLAFWEHTVQIQEPVFVQVSVNVWIEGKAWDAYEAEEMLVKKLDTYLNGRTMRIGDLPRLKELEQVLYQASDRVRVLYFQAVLTYTEDGRRHESALEDMREFEDAVFINGSHKVHTVQ